MKINPRSLTLRASVLYSFILIILISIFVASNYWHSERLLRKQLDWTLQADANVLIELYEIGGIDQITLFLENRLRKPNNDAVVYLLTDDRFQPILGNIPAWPRDLPKDQTWAEVDLYGPHDFDRDIRFLNTRMEDGLHLLVGRETVQIEILEDSTAFYSVLFITVILIFGMVGSLVLHLKLNNRLKIISSNCEHIRSGDLSVRFPTVEKGDEFDDMAGTLNEMLDQIQLLMLDIQHITDNIAHDLRSPMTRVRNKLEQLSTELENPDQQQRALDAIDNLDQLLAIFNAMLKISQIETKSVAFEFEDLDLREIIQDSVELYEALAEENEQIIQLILSDKILIKGDKNLLFQMIGNLLDNAIKYSPAQSTIKVRADLSGGRCLFEVTEQGPGIPEGEFDNITKRFYRLDKSRHFPGNGLGLSLVNAVVQLHGGHLHFSNPEGLCVTIELPRLKS